MARNIEKNHLRAWREFRRMTQAELADKVDTTGAVISLLESGQRGLSDRWLRRLAPVLDSTPGHLLDVDPKDVDEDILEIWSSISETSRPQARSVLKAFRDSAPKVGPPEPSPPSPVDLKAARRERRATGVQKAEKPNPTRGRQTPEGI